MKTEIPTHTPSQPAVATALMAERTLYSHGFFLLPFLQPGFDVLDAGCGPGTITTSIAETVFPGRVTGIDVCASQLAHARRLAQGLEIMNVSFVAAAAGRLPFADGSFDVVFAHALFDHLTDPAPVVQEFHRVIRPGGFIVACSADWHSSDPFPKNLGRAMEASRRLHERKGGNTRAGKALTGWLGTAGFTLLSQDSWTETHDDPRQPAEELAVQLEADGQFHHATALREWASSPAATFRQCWRFATAVRADDHCRPTRIRE